MMLDIQMTIRGDWGCRHLSSPYYYQDHIFTPTMRIQLLADFSRATARAHSTLRCIASPHGPLRVAYSIFRLPRASCSHLVLSIRLSLPRFSLYLCLPTSARHSRLLSACPFPFSTALTVLRRRGHQYYLKFNNLKIQHVGGPRRFGP